MKNYATVQKTDDRMIFLERMLSKTEFARPLTVYAPNVGLDADMLKDIADGSDVVVGKCTDETALLAEKRNIRIFNIMKNEGFQAVNSRLTAEGALMLILQRSQKSISDIYPLVIGFGRMGAAIAKMLSKLDVTFDIATSSSLRPAFAFAKNVIRSENFDFSPYDIIINTAPVALISDSELLTMQKSTIYIDLASKSALNIPYAKYLGIDAEIYPALPAKVCPYSAAKAMYRYISEAIK